MGLVLRLRAARRAARECALCWQPIRAALVVRMSSKGVGCGGGWWLVSEQNSSTLPPPTRSARLGFASLSLRSLRPPLVKARSVPRSEMRQAFQAVFPRETLRNGLKRRGQLNCAWKRSKHNSSTFKADRLPRGHWEICGACYNVPKHESSRVQGE